MLDEASDSQGSHFSKVSLQPNTESQCWKWKETVGLLDQALIPKDEESHLTKGTKGSHVSPGTWGHSLCNRIGLSLSGPFLMYISSCWQWSWGWKIQIWSPQLQQREGEISKMLPAFHSVHSGTSSCIVLRRKNQYPGLFIASMRGPVTLQTLFSLSICQYHDQTKATMEEERNSHVWAWELFFPMS